MRVMLWLFACACVGVATAVAAMATLFAIAEDTVAGIEDPSLNNFTSKGA